MCNVFVINISNKISTQFEQEINDPPNVEDGEQPIEGCDLNLGNEWIHILQFKILHRCFLSEVATSYTSCLCKGSSGIVWTSTFSAVEKWKSTIDIHHLQWKILNCRIWIHSLHGFEAWPSTNCHTSLALGGSLISCSKLTQYFIANNYNE